MKIITIMPDFGLGPYAWQNGAGCIGDAVCGFRGSEFKVSRALEQRFADWIDWFEAYALEPGFCWEPFHRTGMDLARRLKAEIGDQARVVCVKPIEDPALSYGNYAGAEILPDGTLAQLTRPPWKD